MVSCIDHAARGGLRRSVWEVPLHLRVGSPCREVLWVNRAIPDYLDRIRMCGHVQLELLVHYGGSVFGRPNSVGILS